jgi:hypothetical protein
MIALPSNSGRSAVCFGCLHLIINILQGWSPPGLKRRLSDASPSGPYRGSFKLSICAMIESYSIAQPCTPLFCREKMLVFHWWHKYLHLWHSKQTQFPTSRSTSSRARGHQCVTHETQRHIPSLCVEETKAGTTLTAKSINRAVRPRLGEAMNLTKKCFRRPHLETRIEQAYYYSHSIGGRAEV